MNFDEDLQSYVFEVDGVVCSWEDEPEGDYEAEAKNIAENYNEHLSDIIEFMLPDLQAYYGNVTAQDVNEKLGKPIIDPMVGTVTYCEQSFDSMHIFTFEYLDDEFENLQYFSVDG